MKFSELCIDIYETEYKHAEAEAREKQPKLFLYYFWYISSPEYPKPQWVYVCARTKKQAKEIFKSNGFCAFPDYAIEPPYITEATGKEQEGSVWYE